MDTEELGPGQYWIGLNESLFIFPTYSQTDTWKGAEAIVFQSAEGMEISADIGITFSVDPTKVSLLFQKYRRGIEEISDLYLRNMVRDALVAGSSRMNVDTIYSDGKVILLKTAEDSVRDAVAPIGIVVEHLYWVGSLRFPEAIVSSINAKTQATQHAMQRENEIATAKAEAQKQVEVARGEAEAKLMAARAEAEAVEIRGKAEAAAIKAKSDALNASPQLVQYTLAQQWDGKLPETVSASSLPLLNIPVK